MGRERRVLRERDSVAECGKNDLGYDVRPSRSTCKRASSPNHSTSKGNNMQIRSATTRGILVLALIAVFSHVAVADHHEHGDHEKAASKSDFSKVETVEAAAEAEVEVLEKNVEASSEMMKKTYEEKRAEGEGRIEAAGDSYNAVIDEGRKKAAE